MSIVYLLRLMYSFHSFLPAVVLVVAILNTAEKCWMRETYWISATDFFANCISSSFISGYSGLFSGLIVMCMADFQVTRRLLECLFVSVYSGRKMNVATYIVGFMYYVLFAFTCFAGTKLSDGLLLSGLYPKILVPKAIPHILNFIE